MKKNIGFLALLERFNTSRAKTYRYFNTKLSAEYPSNDFTELFNNELSNNPANTGAAELFLASAFLPEFISKIKVKKNPYIEKVVNCQLLEYQTAMNTPAATEPKSVSLDEQEAIFESSVLDLLNNNNLTIQFSKITIDVKKIEPTDTIISIINNSEKNRITQDTIKKLSTIDTIKESLLLNDDTGDTIKESLLLNDDTGDAIKETLLLNDDTGDAIKETLLLNDDTRDTIKESALFNDDTGDTIKETLLLNDDTGDTIKESALFNDDTGDTIKETALFNDDTGDTIKKSSSFNDDTGDKIKEIQEIRSKSLHHLMTIREIRLKRQIRVPNNFLC